LTDILAGNCITVETFGAIFLAENREFKQQQKDVKKRKEEQ